MMEDFDEDPLDPRPTPHPVRPSRPPVPQWQTARTEDPRADELELVADGYAQLAWAASFASLALARRLALKSNDYAWRAQMMRNPWLYEVMRVGAAIAATFGVLRRL